jgi:putative FmdB family regulatory protein
MPVYDFKCRDCGIEFTATATVGQLEKGDAVRCPECGGGNIQQLLTVFTAKTSRKS